ncbi:MAG TPA: tannase/feruloyl esterase family alpha/beta hydrolase [Sellimonas intestinalis]|nr:tannase/feruloyl esterase family alpha/beta hydrolase [Sellimonas intestinalis]
MMTTAEAKKRLEEVVIENGVITQMEVIPADPNLTILAFQTGPMPEYCRVCVQLDPGGNSHIQVELWLPTETWNGNFLGTGNGGAAGSIVSLSLVEGVRAGYATANTDLGTSLELGEMVGAPERWEDFGYLATHRMTVVAKQLIEAFYGKPPKYSYFRGGSTGGQQALREAENFPLDYNGILVEAPANNRTNLHIGFVWDWQALTKTPQAYIDQKTAEAIKRRIYEVYGDTPTVEPYGKFLAYPHLIDLDIKVLEDMKDPALHPDQIEALKAIYAGPVDPVTGEQIHLPVVVPGSEASPLGIPDQGAKEDFPKTLFFILHWLYGWDFDFTTFDFHNDTAYVREKLDAILNADTADLSGFRAAGGKLLMLHGTADPIIPYTSSLDYYERVIKLQGGLESTKEFFRYFLIPGLAHSFGGPIVQIIGNYGAPRDVEHDPLAALAAWVEEEKAPERLLALRLPEGDLKNLFSPQGFEAEIPAYAYPNRMQYIAGDPAKADSYNAVPMER